MSVFAGKNILVIGDETNQVHDIEHELELRGAHIIRTVCSSEPDSHKDLFAADIVLLNHLHDGASCEGVLTQFRNSNTTRTIPVFALVNNDAKSIEEALSLGAADYFTHDEPLKSIVKKISIVLGEPDMSGRSVIEINETAVRNSREGIRVYAVEDDPLLGNLLTMRLEQAKFIVEIDPSGENAVERIREFKPNVVVLDLSLPQHSGFDILELIRRESDIQEVPVIVFSNRDSDEDKERASKLGARAFFIKVMTDFSELIEAIERLS